MHRKGEGRMDLESIAKKIDHTLLKPSASDADFRKLYRGALKYNFRAVCINESALDRMSASIRRRFRKNNILVACVLDFPLGQGGYGNKHFGATFARAKGADELDVVWNIGSFLSGQFTNVLRELKPVAKVLPTKVIVEAAYIVNAGLGAKRTKQLLVDAALLVSESGAFCIKDHTGFGPIVPVEQRAEYIDIWKKAAPNLMIKSAAGIRTLEHVKILEEIGVDIYGTSAGDKIMEEVLRSAKS